jgi:nitrogen regulatory protein PII
MTDTIKLVTVFTEAAIESSIIHELDQLGVPGYTISNARGKGSGGVRSAAWEADANIRIEILCKADLAEQVVERLQARYYEHYSMVMYLSNVDVLRPDKFL